MAYRFAGKVAIVTGAGGGLGFEYASYLAKHGAKVLINDLGGGTFGFDGQPNSSVAEQAAAKIRAAGGEAMANGHSVADFAGAKAMVDQVVKTWGRVDILINNAGITSTKVFPEVDAEELQMHLGVHVIGSVNMMRAAWPHMLAQKSGKIINTASSSLLGFCPQISYPAMKAALLGLTKNTALVGKEHNISVNAILPAAFTRLSGLLPACDFRDHLEKDFLPEKLAPVIAYLCHDSCSVSGEFFSVGGGKFARLVFAETEVANIDMSMESVASAMGNMMSADARLQIINTSFDDLKQLGFSEAECEIFHNMTATQSSSPEFENFESVSKLSIDNVWDITIKSMVGDQKSVLTLKSTGKALIGNTHNEQYGTQEVLKGDFDGKTLVWKTKISKPVPMTLTYTAKIDANENLKGSVKLGMFGESNFVAVPAGDAARKDALQRFQQFASSSGTKKPSFIEKLFSRRKEEVE